MVEVGIPPSIEALNRILTLKQCVDKQAHMFKLGATLVLKIFIFTLQCPAALNSAVNGVGLWDLLPN